MKKSEFLRKVQFQVKKSLHIRYKLENVDGNIHKGNENWEKFKFEYTQT